MNQQKITILGSTGSIGCYTLDIIRAYPEKFKVTALAADKNIQKLIEQAIEFKPEYVVIGTQEFYEPLKEALAHQNTKVLAGFAEIIQIAKLKVDCVMSAIVGASGLLPTMAAILAGQKVALANKESLVCAGKLMMESVAKHKAQLLPVDSEHNALFQLLQGQKQEALDKVIITASGGPFRTWTHAQMEKATPKEAVKHPNWAMGSKISVDSATLMNKGLELIEAAHLFNLKSNQIDVLIHPQSFIHGIVSFQDGSHLLHAAQPDMRIPISYALAYPERLTPPLEFKDIFTFLSQASFEKVDDTLFPSVKLAKEALKIGRNAPTILNAANEVAVHAFLSKKIGFLQIHDLVKKALDNIALKPLQSIGDVLAQDKEARLKTQEFIQKTAA